MDIEELNYELVCIAEEEKQAMIDLEYDAFLDEMYYILECQQYEEDMELFNEFG